LACLGQFALQHRQLGDAVAGLARQPGAGGVGAHPLRVVRRQEQLAHRGQVQGRAASNGPHHLHARALAVGPLHIHNLVALAHAQVHWLLDQLVQLAHGGQCRVAHVEPALDEVTQLQQTHAQPVGARLGALHETAHRQVVEDAVGGGRVQPRLLADLLERHGFLA